MPDIKPFTVPATEIAQRSKERIAQTKSRPGTSSANPPSTNLPATIHLEGPLPPPIPATGPVPFFDPVGSPRDALAGRSVNNTAPTLSVNLTEKSINPSAGGKPLAPHVIAQGGDP